MPPITAGFHLTFDMDGVDPAVAPGVGTPVAGGTNFRESHLVMENAYESGKLLSLEVTEINPILDVKNSTAEVAVQLVLSALATKVTDRPQNFQAFRTDLVAVMRTLTDTDERGVRRLVIETFSADLAARASELRSRITARQEVLTVDIALAQLRGEMGEREQAITSLQRLAQDAESRKWLGQAMEGRLAELRIRQFGTDAPRIASLRSQIETVARQHGFAWVLTRLRALSGPERPAPSH